MSGARPVRNLGSLPQGHEAILNSGLEIRILETGNKPGTSDDRRS
jgi:hypothetical protein